MQQRIWSCKSMLIGDQSMAMGFLTTAKGDNSTAMGQGSFAKPFASLVIGQYNDTTARIYFTLEPS